MNVQVPTSPNVCFCITWENQINRDITQKHTDIFDCKLMKNKRILIIFGKNVPHITQTQITDTLNLH